LPARIRATAYRKFTTDFFDEILKSPKLAALEQRGRGIFSISSLLMTAKCGYPSPRIPVDCI
jgi:hypothetical protein